MDGESGYVQYTRDLLARPPANVEYVTYAQAMASGELIDGPSIREGLALVTRPHHLLWQPSAPAFTLPAAAVHCYPTRSDGGGSPAILTLSTSIASPFA